MSRLADIREQDATGKAADIAGIKKRWQSAERLPDHRRPLAGGAAAGAGAQCDAHKGSSAPSSWKRLICRSSEAPAVTTAWPRTPDGEKAGFSSEQIHALRRGGVCGRDAT